MTSRQITMAVQQLVAVGNVGRLFVYFSGHGVIRGFDDEYWLLSEAATLDTEAINVAKSVAMVFRCGSGHVALFADACRSPASADFIHLSGTSLFPRESIASDVEVDEFFATQFTDPAYEVVANAEGLFTHYLVRALRGKDQAALRDVLGTGERLAVLSNTLKPVLVRNVQFAASRLRRTQRPSCRAGSYWDPNRHVISWVTSVSPPPEQPADKAPEGDLPLHLRSLAMDSQTQAQTNTTSRRYVASTLEGLAQPPSSLGLTIVGGETQHVTDSREPAGATLLLSVSVPGGGPWIGAGRFPGHQGVIVLGGRPGQRTAEHIAYVPTSAEKKAVDPAIVPEMIGSVAARLLTKTLELDALDATTLAALWQDLNPTLAVLLGGELARSGRRAEVRRLLERFAERHSTVPFDLMLFAQVSPDEITAEVVPAFPMLTSSWSLLDDEPHVRTARRLLISSVWTTFAELPKDAAIDMIDAKPREDR